MPATTGDSRPPLDHFVRRRDDSSGSVDALICGVFDASGELVLWLARLWSRVILRRAGREARRRRSRVPLDPGRPYVFMANHASMVDIWAVFVRHAGIVPFHRQEAAGAHPAVRLGDARREASSSSTARTRSRRGGRSSEAARADPGGPVGRDLSRRDAHPRRARWAPSRRAASTWRSTRAPTSCRSRSRDRAT